MSEEQSASGPSDGREERDPRLDPAYWKEKLGSAGSLVDDFSVEGAIQQGKFHKLHALLRKKRAELGGLGDQEALDAVLADRRLFVQPSSAPGMFTLNGFGTRCAGKDDVGDDGTYIVTHVLSFLFAPVLPLGQYLVADADKGWYFLGKVPMSSARRTWRLGAFAVAALVVGAVAFLVHKAGTHDDVHLANGLDVPVEIEVAGETTRVPAHGHAVVELPAGTHRFVARAGGREVESIEGSVPGDADLVVYNVLGVAPLFIEHLPYMEDESTEEEYLKRYRYELLAGPSWVVRKDVDLPFEPAPDSVRLRGDVVVKSRAAVHEGGWRTTLYRSEDGEEAARIARDAAMLSLDDEDAILGQNV